MILHPDCRCTVFLRDVVRWLMKAGTCTQTYSIFFVELNFFYKINKRPKLGQTDQWALKFNDYLVQYSSIQ